MKGTISPRRAALTVLFSLWLSVQFVAVALSPTWGFLLPHEHVLRGVISERAWQEHLREHRLGLKLAMVTRCDVPVQRHDGSVMGSFPDVGGAFSLHALMSALVSDARVEIPAAHSRHTLVWLHDVTAFDV